MAPAASDAERVIKMKTRRPLYELRLSTIGTIVNHASVDCTGILPFRRLSDTGAKPSITKPGRTPTSRHSVAKTNIAARENPSTSFAPLAAGLRARPRKLTPNALTKQAAASAADKARSAPTAGAVSFNPHCGSCGLRRIAWKVIHSETKPLNGGSAEMAAQPTRTTEAVCGMR